MGATPFQFLPNVMSPERQNKKLQGVRDKREAISLPPPHSVSWLLCWAGSSVCWTMTGSWARCCLHVVRALLNTLGTVGSQCSRSLVKSPPGMGRSPNLWHPSEDSRWPEQGGAWLWRGSAHILASGLPSLPHRGILVGSRLDKEASALPRGHSYSCLLTSLLPS